MSHVIICSAAPISHQLLTTSWLLSSRRSSRSRGLARNKNWVSHTGAGGLAWGGNSYPETRRGRFLDHLRRRVDFNATVDHERDLVLVCCLLLLLWLSTAWLWLWLPVVSGLDHLHIMDMDPVWSWIHPISFETTCSSQRYLHIL